MPRIRLSFPKFTWLRGVVAMFCVTASCSCSTVGYYAQLAQGQVSLLSRREPVDALIADARTDPKLKTRLALTQTARAFASDQLKLPRNRSYTLYADLGRSSVMWNVFAAPEFSLQPVTHCFPIAGCVAYRGYYAKDNADSEAERLRAKGDDVYVGGVAAYSTLGWFDDPILSTMLHWDDDELVGTIFHELAHQKLYLAGDTAFNESFATFVQEEGLRQWHRARGEPAEHVTRDERDQQFVQLILKTRAELEKLYASEATPESKRLAKQTAFAHLRDDYAALRATQWRDFADYDAWMQGDLNNAKLLPFGLYHQWIAAFAALYTEQSMDWIRFYAAATQLSKLSVESRTQRLETLAKSRTD
jgi:predicted aminopeptidase